MRKRGEIWPEVSREYLRTLPEELAEALQRVYTVFARPSPEGMGYCHCCVPPEQMDRVLHTPYRELTAGAVEQVLQAGLTMGRWQDVAYFIPKLLEGFLAGSLCTTSLYYRILQSARPDYSAFTRSLGKSYDTVMPDVERQCLFEFFGEALRYWTETIETPSYQHRALRREFLIESIGFLATLGSPLGPVLRRWRDCYPPPARLLVSLVLADLMFAGSGGHWQFRNVYAERLVLLPENELALKELLQPGAVTEYLASNTDYFWMLDEARGELRTIETAFDLASAYQ